MLYLYAVLDPRPGDRWRGGTVTGACGEPVTFVGERPLVVAAGRVEGAPPLSPATLRAQDEVVQRLARRSAAILPVRFGTLIEGEPAVREILSARGAGLLHALRSVAGCAQMTVRVYGPPLPAVRRPAAAPGGMGAAYLAARAAARRPAMDTILVPLRGRIGGLVRAERVERHDRAPLVATVHHLVWRREVDAYRRLLVGVEEEVRPWRLTINGPWAPYAFAPEAVA
jgi:hypothetical protein